MLISVISPKASPGNLSQLEEVLFGASTDCTITTGVMAVKVAADGNQKVSVARSYTGPFSLILVFIDIFSLVCAFPFLLEADGLSVSDM